MVICKLFYIWVFNCFNLLIFFIGVVWIFLKMELLSIEKKLYGFISWSCVCLLVDSVVFVSS